MVRVAYTVTEANLIEDDYPRILVPLRVTTSEGLSSIMEILNKTSVVPFDEVKGFFMTGAIFVDQLDLSNLPVKGDLILASFDYDESSSKLICNGLSQLPREELEYIKAEELLGFHAKMAALLHK